MNGTEISRRGFSALAMGAGFDLAQTSKAPRIEVVGPRLVTLRFDTQLIHDRHSTMKANAACEFSYRIPVPDWLERAGPQRLELTANIKAPGNLSLGVNGTPVVWHAGKPTVTAETTPSPEIEIHFKADAGVTVSGDAVLQVHTASPAPYRAGWRMNENSGAALPPLKPLFDYDIRDTSVILGGDGNFYLTGTTGSPDMWGVTSELQVWKSPDLKTWTPVVEKPRARSVVWSVDREGSWEKPIRLRDDAPFRPLWAPEIHYLKGTYWLTYSLPFLGVGLLKSASGEARGPYTKAFAIDQPIADGIDASLFEDTDGKVYFLYSGGRIARIKDDMSGLAEPFRQLAPAEGGAPYVGFEGVYLFRANGKYHLTAADFVFGDYHCYAAMSDNIYGPYSARYLAVPHAGHNTFFQDKKGNWWSTLFGNDPRAPFLERPAALPIAFTKEGRIKVAG